MNLLTPDCDGARASRPQKPVLEAKAWDLLAGRLRSMTALRRIHRHRRFETFFDPFSLLVSGSFRPVSAISAPGPAADYERLFVEISSKNSTG
jgi:hypothetical protein